LQLRAAILASDLAISEHVKWNAPSFCYGGQDRVTFRLQPRGRLQLIFPDRVRPVVALPSPRARPRTLAPSGCALDILGREARDTIPTPTSPLESSARRSAPRRSATWRTRGRGSPPATRSDRKRITTARSRRHRNKIERPAMPRSARSAASQPGRRGRRTDMPKTVHAIMTGHHSFLVATKRRRYYFCRRSDGPRSTAA